MRNPIGCALALALLLAAGAVIAQEGGAGGVRAVTDDGRTVLLNPDGTWSYATRETGSASSSAVLSVTDLVEMEQACGLQLRLQNNLGYRIRSLVPRLSVHNQDNIVFDSKSVSFTSLKPTADQYKRVQFSGIGCRDIKWIRVYDASRCTMGELDVFNEEAGECLRHIYVEPSTLINISK